MVAKFRMSVKRPSRRDVQQYLLYRMEKESFGGLRRGKMTQKEMQSFANAVCRNYAVPQVSVRFKDLGQWAGQCWADGRIDINPKKTGSLSVLCIAHELAHHIHNNLVPDKRRRQHQSHGPEFLACYISVFDTARIVPSAGMRAVLDTYKLKYIDPGDDNSLATLRKRISKSPKSSRPE